MSEVHEIGQDLRFVRQAVARRERRMRGPWLEAIWAIYIVIGYTMLDFNPARAGMFFAIGGVAGALLTWFIAKRWAVRSGEIDRSEGRRAMAHFMGGILLAWAFCVGLAVMNESLRGTKGSQVFVVMIGLVYFLWGVHEDRYYLFLGPLVMLGGVLVVLAPHFGWTMLGLVIALALIAPRLLPSRNAQLPASAGKANVE